MNTVFLLSNQSKLLYLFILLLLPLTVMGQIPKSFKSIENIKTSKVVIKTSDSKSRDAKLIEVVEANWSLSPIEGNLDFEQIIEKASMEDFYVLSIEIEIFTRMNCNAGLCSSMGYYLSLSKPRNGKLYTSFYSPLIVENGKMEKDIMSHAVLNLQSNIETVFANNYTKGKELLDHFELNHQKLKGKTLLIPERFLHKKITTSESIKKVYKGDFKIVNDEDYNSAITNKMANSAYLVIAPLVRPGATYVYLTMVIDSETKETLYRNRSGLGGKAPSGRKDIHPKIEISKSILKRLNKIIANK